MSLHSAANRLCLEVPAASLRGTAAAAALPSARDGARCPRSGHPTLAGCGGFAGHVQITGDKPLQHLCAGESLWAQGCQPCQKNLGFPGLILGQRSEKSDPSLLQQLWPVPPASLLEERQPCFITHPSATRLVWWVRCCGATRKGSRGLDELSGRNTNWRALKRSQWFSVL